MTGATWFTGALAAKRLGLLRELLPTATTGAILVNPENARAAHEIRDAQEAARAIGWRLLIVDAKNESEIEAAFATIVQRRANALLVAGDAFFSTRRDQFASLAARHGVPALYSVPGHVMAGGLLSYGAISTDAHRQAGIYAARILKGAKPADLPVVLPTEFKLVINLKTAKALGLEVPPTLLARADEVIE